MSSFLDELVEGKIVSNLFAAIDITVKDFIAGLQRPTGRR